MEVQSLTKSLTKYLNIEDDSGHALQHEGLAQLGLQTSKDTSDFRVVIPTHFSDSERY